LPLAIFVFPAALTLVASAAHRYPFGGARVDLFLIPAVLLLAASGVTELQAMLPPHRSAWALAAAAPLVLMGIGQAGYSLVVPRCSSHLRPAVDFVKSHDLPGDEIVLEGDETWPVFFCYWPNPPGTVAMVKDGGTATTSGRFWCVCEYAPGEFARKRKPTIDAIARGATPVPGNSFTGRGGSAFLYARE
jgi:hypothetical protein